MAGFLISRTVFILLLQFAAYAPFNSGVISGGSVNVVDSVEPILCTSYCAKWLGSKDEEYIVSTLQALIVKGTD